MSNYQYYQPNKKDIKDKYGDCQVRAIAGAIGISWLEAFDLIQPICREFQTLTPYDLPVKERKQAMARLGFDYHGVTNKRGSKRPTVATFAQSHNIGRYIVTVSHHVVAVVNGKYLDTWDSGDKSVYGYFEYTGY